MDDLTLDARLNARPHTTPNLPQARHAFADARMGAFQLKAMGLTAFGGFHAYKKERPVLASAPAGLEDGPPAPAMPPTTAVWPTPPPPSSVPGIAALSARRPWETARAASSGHAERAERLPWESPRSARARRPPTPSTTVPPRSYARPASREDAVGLGTKLQTALGQGLRHDAQDREWHDVFLELVRQVYVHCNERGQLLDTVRVHLESQLSQARSRLGAEIISNNRRDHK